MTVEGTRLAVFDSLALRESFYPLLLTRPSCDLLVGSSTQLGNIERMLGTKVTDLIVPPYLEGVCREAHPGIRVNETISERCIAVNGLVSPGVHLLKALERRSGGTAEFCLVDARTGEPVIGSFSAFGPDAQVADRGIGGSSRFAFPLELGETPIFRYPWEVVAANGYAIEQLPTSRNKKLSFWGDIEVRGNRLSVSESAEIERFVAFDTSAGPVVIDERVTVESFSRLTGPCYVGRDSRIMSAKIRSGTSIGANCKIAGELEESIVLPYSNKSHEGFIGHSLLGSWVNIGAMSSNSDLKNTYGKIKVNIGKGVVEANTIKVGCFLGDMSKTAIGSTIFTGRKVGVCSQVIGAVTRDVPSFTIAGPMPAGNDMREVMFVSAVETQKRMMERRKLKMSASLVQMLRSVFRMTQRERQRARVRKGRFKLG